MKRYMALAVLLSVLMGLLSGCGFWMNGERISVEPYQEQRSSGYKETVKVSTYMQMRNAVANMVESGAESGILIVSSFKGGSVHFYMDTTIRYVTDNNPLAAYAVDHISYEIGTNVGEEAVAVNIAYRYDHAHLLRIAQAEGMEDAFGIIADSLKSFDPSVVVRVPAYEETDFLQWVRDYAAENPDVVMETPAVAVSVYPERGKERIVALDFTYQTSRESLKQMQETVEPVFTAAELYVKNAYQVREKYAQLYSFLMERSDYVVETSITPAYSLLNHGVGDSKAFANVYAAMCNKADLECYVITGTRDGAPWTWNLICFRGAYYHLDLLRSGQTGEFSPLLRSAMEGYVWDYSAYPE